MLPLRVINKLYSAKSYWLIKKWFGEKPLFYYWKNVYRGRYSFNESRNTFLLLLPTLSSFIRTALYAIFIITILQAFHFLFPVDQKTFDGQAIDTFLATIASVSGVFLGLYFTAISSIASNLLIRATQDIRRFFLSAPRGQQYVQTVALTGIISVFYIVAKSFGYLIHPVGLGFLALLVVYVVIRFWTVGSEVFNSLEPTGSLPWVTRDIANLIKNVVPPGFQWVKPVIQNHQRRLSVGKLELISNLTSFGINEIKLSDEQLITALQYLGGLLFFYSDNKRKIPTDSYWYKTKVQHESWTLANSTQIVIALNTGTTLQSKTVKDFTWFEEDVLDNAVKILKHFVGEKKVGSVYQGFEIFVDVAEAYGKDFDEQGLRMFFQKLDEITKLVQSINIDVANQVVNKELLAFVDSQGRLAVAALLGLMKYLDVQTSDNLVSIFSKIDWASDSKSIYLTGLPLTMVSRFESIALELKNEKLIEGRCVSQEWYIETLCFQRYLFSLQNYFNYIKSLHQDYFKRKFEKMFADEQLPLVAQLILRWVEFSNKYQGLISILRKHVEDCNRFRLLKDLPWAAFDFNQEQKVAQDGIKEITDKMIALLPKLKSLVTGEDVPDYFGQALTMGVGACFDACDNNDHERLRRILPAVFDASISAYDLTREKVKGWSEDESKIIFSTEPLENLYEISGYAKLYSELHQNIELWNTVQRLWDIYFNTVSDARQVIEFIVAMSSYRDSVFKIMPQATLRSNWQIAFAHRMRECGLPVFPDHDSYDFVNRRRHPTHPSPLIRVITRWGGLRMMSSARTVFFATYLANLSVADNIEFPDKRDLREAIQEEEQRNNDEIIDEDEQPY